MNNPTILMPPELEARVSKRSQIWSDYDKAEGDANRLRGMQSKASNKGDATELDPLTADQTPPAELLAAVQQLEKEIAEMERLQQSVSDSESEIRSIEERYRTLMTWAIIALVVVVVVLFFMLT